jgi:hypothetical protein
MHGKRKVDVLSYNSYFVLLELYVKDISWTFASILSHGSMFWLVTVIEKISFSNTNLLLQVIEETSQNQTMQ